MQEGDWSGSCSTGPSGSDEHSDRKNRGAEDRASELFGSPDNKTWSPISHGLKAGSK